MTLILNKTQFTEEAEDFWIVKCKTDGATPTVIKQFYSFPLAETDASMETKITTDLTNKGYTDISPVEWE